MSKLKEILSNLWLKGYQQGSNNQKITDITQAEKEILELIPEKKNNMCLLSNKDLIFTGEFTECRSIKDWIKYGYNQAITDMKQRLGGMQ